jgi:Tol biopolymer transport system component/uncharacterized protein YjbI with pentapeptide repeats
MTLIANRLSRLLSASKHRILSMAGTLRRSLMANKLRSLLIGGVLLFVIAPASVGLLIYSFGGSSYPQQEARQVDPRCLGSLAQSTENSKLVEDSNDTQIAFTRTIAGDAIESELYVMVADGTNETQLTNTSAVGATSPEWSPDGKRIAYLRGIDVDSGRTDRDIYVIDADGTNQSSVTTVGDETTTIAWSPDGQKIAFDGGTRSGVFSGRPGIYLINPDGTGLEYLTEGTRFSWSPDRKKIAFVIVSITSHSSAASTVESDLYVRRIDGGDLTRLTNTPDTAESTPVWSPDSTKIAFTSAGLSGSNDIYVMNADGSGQDHLTDGSSPVWSPDSKKIAFIRDSGIYVMNADGTCETHLTNLNYLTPGVSEDVLDWSPDGEKIAFKSASSGSNDIYVINADGSERTNLTNSKQSEDYFAWSPARIDTSTERTEEAVEDQQPIDAAPKDEALQAYIEQINELLAEKNLRVSEEGSDVRQLAREKTLQVLEGSDPSTKEKAVRFLAEADLVQDVGQRVPIISLSNTDLGDANLSGIDLRGADFRAANLGSSDLQKADLSGADLTDADLTSADLIDAQLQRANLTDADLTGANLTNVQLQRANMTNATLHATDLTRADLTGANLTGVYMTAAERREAEQSATGVYLPVENEAKVRAWEAEARSSLKGVYASLERCLATIARVEDWRPMDSPEELRDSKIIRCTNSADSDTFFKYYEDDLRPNVSWNMIQQTKQTPNGLENTGEVVIQVQHEQGGSGFQTSTATNGRIERIPRYF